MKIPVNNNFLFTSVFVETLVKLGVKNVCISPGSRNTPLSLAFAENKKIKKTIILDERSSAFFALGIALRTKTPVAVVTTSGSAVAELYPAITEAFNSRVPLLILTADRPPELHGKGANQTINQESIFDKNILASFNAGLPKTDKTSLQKLLALALKAYSLSLEGPVHVNFPLRKPLEPWSTNAFVEEKTLKSISNFTPKNRDTTKARTQIPVAIINEIEKAQNILIFSGGGTFDQTFNNAISRLALKIGAPVIVDAYSPLKFRGSGRNNFLFNTAGLLHSQNFKDVLKPDLILHFGNAPTSSTVLNYFEELNTPKILINPYGDVKDPSGKYSSLLKIDPVIFCNGLLEKAGKKNSERVKLLKSFDKKAENYKEDFLAKLNITHEPKLIFETIKLLPDNVNLFVSNSMPVRDLDYFAPASSKRITLFTNRGVSGIDGITSTTTGIAYSSKKPTFLFTGDLAFLHDLNALQTIVKYNIDLTIIISDNNGGGIFRLLPVAKSKKHFEDIFITPHNLDLSKIAKAFGAKYFSPKTLSAFEKAIITARSENGLKIIRVETNSKLSTETRQEYFTKLSRAIDDADWQN